MKSLTIPAGILILIFGFSLWTSQYVEKRTNDWTVLLEKADEAARQDDWAAATADVERAYDDWNSIQTFLHTIIEHEELDEAENLFIGATTVCQEEERVEFRKLLAQLMEQLKALSETQSLGIKNIL